MNLNLQQKAVCCLLDFKMKKNTKKIFSKKADLCYLEIILLVASMFAVSYLIYSETAIVSAVDYSSSEGVDTYCCEKTKNGMSCIDGSVSECDTNFSIAPASCESTSFCQIGCCSSNVDGICNKRSPKGTCTSKNGTFYPDPSCNVQVCKEGCCLIGNEARWLTEKTCKFEGNSQNKDIPTDWKYDENTDSELKCLFSVRKNDESACLYKSGDEQKCIYTTLYDCIARTGSESNYAHNQTFCSDPVLNTTCKAKDHKGCLSGKEDVYWFDSCGNHEDVAKDCTFSQGNYCGKVGNDYECKDVNCMVDGVKRLNGESWCEYDGAIGVDESKSMKDQYGRDAAGSRQIKHICYMGTERIEPCADYRNEICVQEDSTTKDGNSFSQANCRTNNWRQCMEINTKKQNVDDMQKECKKNPDCFVKEIDMAGSFHFFVCLPSYPPGFKLDDNYTLVNGMEIPSSSQAICSTATQKCTETWVCSLFGCMCVDNCKCHTSYFTEKMNEFCVSLGDCGSYINYIGVFTNAGYGLKSTCASNTCGKGPPRLGSTSQYSKNAGPQSDQKPAKPGDFEFYQTLNPDTLREVSTDENITNFTAFQRELLEVAGSMGSPYLLRILNQNESLDPQDVGSISSRPVDFSGFYNGFSSVKSMISSQIVTKETKAGGFEMIGAMIAGLIAYLITESILFTLLAAMLAYLFMLAWVVYVDINFVCDTWEQPDGGADCNQCNKKEVPCTEYRCQSLGAACQFINKGTPNELCVSRPENATFPKINPLESVISSGYSYYNVDSNGFEVVDSKDNGCVEAYSVVRMGIKVDPFAKCKYGTDPNQNYDEMPNDFGVKGNSILPIHQMDLFFPSPEAFKNIYNLTDKMIKQLGQVDMYVKCKTASGKVNPETYHIKSCIKPGPDLTPPIIVYTDPLKDAYVKYGVDNQDITIYTNEPANCKWSKTNKENFDEMENNFNCEKNPRGYTMYGLPCNGTLTDIGNSTKYYFKCRDTSENSNTMKDNYEYSLQVSKNPLIIEDMKPVNNEDIISNVEPTSFKLRAKTSGGAEDGKSICSWSGNGYSDQFTETDSTLHSYTISNGMKGSYSLKFTCKDVAGNIAENTTSFYVSVKKYGPQISRIYYESGLKIMTDSDTAECKYSFDRLSDYENATAMSKSENSFFASWEPRTYYVQCTDSLGNKGSKISVKPYDIYRSY